MDDKNLREERFDDVFAAYRGGGDGNAGSGADLWDEPAPPGPYDGAGYDGQEYTGPRPSPGIGIAALVLSILPMVPSVAGLVFGIIAAQGGRRDGYRPNMILGRIAIAISAVRLVFTVLAVIFTVWLFYNATIGLPASLG